CADLGRAGDLASLLAQAKHSLCIDHHQTNAGYAQENWIIRCSSTGEMIFTLLQALGIPLTLAMATCLYAAVATDTGNFSYSNVTPDTFRTAAHLLECGIPLPELNRRLFRITPVKKTRMIGVVLQNLELLAEGRFALSAISQSELKRWHASGEDCEGLIDYLRDMEGVEVSCLLRESIDGRIRVSLRALLDIDVSEIALQFGGGGHRRAAGITLSCTLEEAKEQMKAAILPYLPK
ncbi:MAG: DHHA1 domain-containing protein, partial [Clostridiales bacterium]|nr:DHHA1 domain-containing protein [Clostridiales bacterium]